MSHTRRIAVVTAIVAALSLVAFCRADALACLRVADTLETCQLPTGLFETHATSSARGGIPRGRISRLIAEASSTPEVLTTLDNKPLIQTLAERETREKIAQLRALIVLLQWQLATLQLQHR